MRGGANQKRNVIRNTNFRIANIYRIDLRSVNANLSKRKPRLPVRRPAAVSAWNFRKNMRSRSGPEEGRRGKGDKRGGPPCPFKPSLHSAYCYCYRRSHRGGQDFSLTEIMFAYRKGFVNSKNTLNSNCFYRFDNLRLYHSATISFSGHCDNFLLTRPPRVRFTPFQGRIIELALL